jgi:predicted RNase H-like HicB family nuclease
MYRPACSSRHRRVDPRENLLMPTYAVRLADRYDGMIIATIPDIPEAMAMGRDYEEACEEAQHALDAALELYAAEGRPFPAPCAAGKLKVTSVKFGELQAA